VSVIWHTNVASHTSFAHENKVVLWHRRQQSLGVSGENDGHAANGGEARWLM
jgi:hypothetical protein